MSDIWTTEPVSVAGRYWFRNESEGVHRIHEADAGETCGWRWGRSILPVPSAEEYHAMVASERDARAALVIVEKAALGEVSIHDLGTVNESAQPVVDAIVHILRERDALRARLSRIERHINDLARAAPKAADFEIGGKYDYDTDCGNADDVARLGEARESFAVIGGLLAALKEGGPQA